MGGNDCKPVEEEFDTSYELVRKSFLKSLKMRIKQIRKACIAFHIVPTLLLNERNVEVRDE